MKRDAQKNTPKIIIIEKREGKNLKNDMMDCFVEKGGGGEEVRIIIVLYPQ